jgi:hypothetical protein
MSADQQEAHGQSLRIRNRCNELLAMRGYDHADMAGLSRFVRHGRPSFSGSRGDYETLCVRVCRTGCRVSDDIAEFLCWPDVCFLRSILITAPGETFLRCEVWLIPPDESVHCFEVTATGIFRVAVYAG